MPRILPTSFAAIALALTGVCAPQAATARLVLDPEKRVLERAGWTYVGMTDGVVIYMKDAMPGSTDDGARRVLTAFEVLAPQDRDGFSFRSIQSVGEFDCANGRSRVLTETLYERPALKGKTQVNNLEAESEWSDAIEGSVGLMRIVFACRERPIT